MLNWGTPMIEECACGAFMVWMGDGFGCTKCAIVERNETLADVRKVLLRILDLKRHAEIAVVTNHIGEEAASAIQVIDRLDLDVNDPFGDQRKKDRAEHFAKLRKDNGARAANFDGCRDFGGDGSKEELLTVDQRIRLEHAINGAEGEF